MQIQIFPNNAAMMEAIGGDYYGYWIGEIIAKLPNVCPGSIYYRQRTVDILIVIGFYGGVSYARIPHGRLYQVKQLYCESREEAIFIKDITPRRLRELLDTTKHNVNWNMDIAELWG